jgi:hypothetical protein
MTENRVLKAGGSSLVAVSGIAVAFLSSRCIFMQEGTFFINTVNL